MLPVINDYWERAEFPWPLARRLAELELLDDGLSPLALGLVHMELNRGDGSLGTFFGVQTGLAMKAIAMLGSPEQQARWLDPMARLETIGAFALTEPDHGSDSVALETTARRDGDDWVLDGAKRWIGNGTIADVVVVWARSTEDGQVKGFLVETDTPGYEAAVITGKGAARAVWQADIRLDGVRVPEAARLPGADTFKDAGRVLVTTRGTVAWGALGHADGGLRHRAHLRRAAPPVRAPAGELPDRPGPAREDARRGHRHAALLHAARPAGRDRPRQRHDRRAREAQQHAQGPQVIAEARDLLGGNGILLENHVIRHMSDIEVLHTFEGTETIQALIVGRDITGSARSRELRRRGAELDAVGETAQERVEPLAVLVVERGEQVVLDGGDRAFGAAQQLLAGRAEP